MTHAEPQLDSGLQLEEVPCDFCGATAADLLLVGRDRMCGVPGMFHVVTCRQCGLARTNPRPTLATLGRAYTSDYVCHQESTMPSGAPQGFLRWALVNYGGYPLGRRAPALVRWLAWLPASARLRNRKLVYYLPYEGQGRLLDFGLEGRRHRPLGRRRQDGARRRPDVARGHAAGDGPAGGVV
jgi:hypothetical protein